MNLQHNFRFFSKNLNFDKNLCGQTPDWGGSISFLNNFASFWINFGTFLIIFGSIFDESLKTRKGGAPPPFPFCDLAFVEPLAFCEKQGSYLLF